MRAEAAGAVDARHADAEAFASASVDYRADLHVHFNGAVPSSAIQDVLADEGTVLPPGFSVPRDLVHLLPCESLAAYLGPWRLLRLLPRRRQNLDYIADAAFAEFKENGLRFVELRSSVLYLATLQQCSPVEALARIIESTRSAADRFGIHRGLLLTVPRGAGGPAAITKLLRAYEDLGRPKDVVGLDLAGDEEIEYPPELPNLFREAKDQYDLPATIHAGETGRSDNIRTAVELFGAARVGHGTAAVKDPAVMDLLSSRDVCVEVCPISNRLTGAVPLNEVHPLSEFWRHGVPFVICSDNPAIHGRGLVEDTRAAVLEGLSAEALRNQFDLAKRYTFMKGMF